MVQPLLGTTNDDNSRMLTFDESSHTRSCAIRNNYYRWLLVYVYVLHNGRFTRQENPGLSLQSRNIQNNYSLSMIKNGLSVYAINYIYNINIGVNVDM